MGLHTTLENKLRWLAFPSLLRGIAIIHFVVILLLMARPEVGNALTFDWAKILGGEVWRIISFLFLPIQPAPEGAELVIPFYWILFAFFALMISFLFNDSLENTWGIWRTSVYFYLVIIGQMTANIILSLMGLPAQPAGGMYLYLAAFFAFATLFPNHTFLVMLIIPVKVWILATLSGAILLLSSIGSLSFSIFVLLTFLPYLWWALPMAIRQGKNRSTVAKRRVEFQSKVKSSDTVSFHRCAKCGATEASHPDRDFRVDENDEEVCSDCL